MNHLLRELAPISDAAWAEIDSEATRTLTHFFAARKLVDFDGPLGYDASAVSLGRLQRIGDQPADGVTANRRQLLPLVELHRRFTLSRSELESIDRGADDPDLDSAGRRLPGDGHGRGHAGVRRQQERRHRRHRHGLAARPDPAHRPSSSLTRTPSPRPWPC